MVSGAFLAAATRSSMLRKGESAGTKTTMGDWAKTPTGTKSALASKFSLL